jgi:hypothetical protein
LTTRLTEAGAEAIGIKRGPEGERLVITIDGRLITKEVPLTGDLLKDIACAKAAAARSVIAARSLTGAAARNLSNRLAIKGARSTTRDRQHWEVEPTASRQQV